MALSDDARQLLLSLARNTIVREAQQLSRPDVDLSTLPDELVNEGASFVTLTQFSQLRGCIGSLEARQPLVLDVRDNAANAAFQDPRFPPVTLREVEDLVIEISILSKPEPLPYEGPDDLIARLRPGIDGVVIQKGWNRATFLPQVWDKLPDPHQFVEHLCLKAHLPADAYRRQALDVSVYQVEEFSERQDAST
ncbi:MAG: AmmeMemoRadiSam system protein A [Chloroflexi bacterium]|nr:AmmeMemoRadiSam system protein A [Chloroflexota bacterium]